LSDSTSPLQAVQHARYFDSKLAGPAGARAASTLRVLCDILLRHALHGVVCFITVATPHIWSSPVYYLLATNGMLYVNFVNVKLLLSKPEGACFAQLLAAASHGESK
jgi:hypothetical protein